MKHAVVLVSGLAVALAFGHPWACFHGDPQHTGRSVNIVGAPLSRIGVRGLDDQISGSPVVRQDGCVLVGARDAKLYCLGPDLDTLLWAADLTPYGSNIYYSSPALDDSDNVYITTNRRLVKVSGNGVVLWSWPSNNALSISHSPVIGQDGKVYFACYSESLYAMTPEGTLAWAYPLGRAVNSAPVIGLDGNVLVATTRGSAPWPLFCVGPDGELRWIRNLDGDAEFSSPAVGTDGAVYVGANRYLYAVRPDGTLKWRDSLLARIQSCPAAANESTLYVVAGAGLYRIDADSGVRWRKSIGGSNYSSPAVDAEGNVYVVTAGGASSVFYCIGPDSTVRDSYIFSDDIWSSPAIGTGGRVYFGCMNDSLYLFQGPGAALSEQGQGLQPVVVRLLSNPTHGVVRLTPAGRYTARVFDAAGSQVASVRDADRLDLRGLRHGVYLIQVAASGCAPQKLVLR